METKVIFLMGVSGSGKTSLGRIVAHQLGLPFFDGDDFHPASNINKMKAGIPLTDADRYPWLEMLHKKILQQLETGSLVVACSALRQSYRNLLENSIAKKTMWVFLKGDKKIIDTRMKQRSAHFMPSLLLQNQLDTLEEPNDALILNILQTPEELAAIILERFQKT